MAPNPIRIRRGDLEFTAPSPDWLRHWASEGRIGPGDWILDAEANQWRRAIDDDRLAGAFPRRKARPVFGRSFWGCAGIFVLLAAGISVVHCNRAATLREEARQRKIEAREQEKKDRAEAAAAAAEKLERQRAEWDTKRPQVLNHLRTMLRERRWWEARALAGEWLAVGGAEVGELHGRAVEAIQEDAALDRRKIIAAKLRENFLDSGLDIKVQTSGKKLETIRFEFALFSDVWSHRFSKDGLIGQCLDAGFTRVEMSNEYDWERYWVRK